MDEVAVVPENDLWEGFPVTAIDGAGRAIVVWDEELASGDYRLSASRFDVDAGWQSSEILTETAYSDTGDEQILHAVVGDDGVAHVVWRRTQSTGGELVSRTFDGAAWIPEEIIPAGGDSALKPRLGVDVLGKVLLVWDSPTSIHANRYVDGAWSGPTDIANGQLPLNPVHSSKLSVAMNGDGGVLWLGTSSDVVASVFVAPPEGTSGAATLVSPTPGSTFSSDTVTFERTDAPGATQYRIWLGSSPGSNDIQVVYMNSSTMKTATGLPTDGSTIYAQLRTQVNGTWLTNDYTFTAHTQ